MYSEITAAIQSAKTVFDLLKATQGLSNSTEVLTAMNDVQMKLNGERLLCVTSTTPHLPTKSN